MRTFAYITVGKILNDLRNEGIVLSRPTFYRIEKSLKFPHQEKSSGNWRVYTQSEALVTKNLIKKNYKTEETLVTTSKISEDLDYLTKLFELKNKGIVTEKEFEVKKRLLLGI